MMQFLLVLCLLLTSAAGSFAGPDKGAARLRAGEPYYEYVQTDVLVKFKAETPATDISALAGQIGAKVAHWSDLLDYYRIEIPATISTKDAVAFFRGSPMVMWANFNYIAHAMWTPNDQYYPYQWHYPKINMPQAWDITRGSANVIVADADQGWDFSHPDFAGVQTVSPYDFIDNDSDPQQPSLCNSHGMHTAGTILAATNNNGGVAGIAPLCRLMPIRVLGDDGSGPLQAIADGIAWAGAHGANVLNLSLGMGVSGPPQDPGPPLSTAVAQTAAAGTVICASSGNEGQPYVAYPAAYPECIAVGATAYDDAIAPYSNQGQELDVTAPGGNVEQDLNGDGYPDGVLSTTSQPAPDCAFDYEFWQGTSMAAPHVSGVAALLISNGLPANQVRNALEETAVDLGASGWDVTFGHGRIDAFAALQWQGGGPGGEITLLACPFEGTVEGWTILENGGNGIGWQWLAGGSPDCQGGPHGGTNAVWHDDEQGVGAQDDWLISPQVAIPGNATSVSWTFWQRNCWVGGYYEYHGILFSTDGQNWNEVAQLNQDQADWAQISIDASALAGSNVYFAWRYRGTYATEWFLDDLLITAVVPGAADDGQAAMPKSIALLDPYPNPFNSVTQISFNLPATSRIEVGVFNVLGQKVATLVTGEFTAGEHRLTWDASDVTSGLYFVKLTSGASTQTKKLLLVK